MAINLPKRPPILPIISKSNTPVTPTSGRKDGLISSVLRPNEKADTSISRLGRDQAKRATTSINRVSGKDITPTTSIFHAGNKAILPVDDSYSDEVRDRNRYTYIREKMKEKREQAKIAKAEEKVTLAGSTGESKYSIAGLKTGSGFRSKGRYGLKRKLANIVRSSPATYKNLSVADRRYFSDMVSEHAHKVSVGKGFDRLARRSMKYKVEKDRQAGKISYQDATDFKKMIDNLPK